MGNQLVGIAPSQIFPVEHYLTEHPNLKFGTSLGSTRFFKVAHAGSTEGQIVVKVFAIHDPSLPLATHKAKVEEIRLKLSSAFNCLPFQKAVLTDKAGFLMREYVKCSLYDRMSTRPFLTSIEKRWIAFQILYALHQCHKVGVCHGDIKLENIMVTSWLWVFLVDFASFKPTYLPEYNPADYSYFFDTSRRRLCYIAPERFVNTDGSLEGQMFLGEDDGLKGDLTPAMDIFSAGYVKSKEVSIHPPWGQARISLKTSTKGKRLNTFQMALAVHGECALAELFTEGNTPFDLADLLAYRHDEFKPKKCLDRIQDVDIKNLIEHMIQRDPLKRLSAEAYLHEQRGRAFPEAFYTFLQSYLLNFSSSPTMPADEKIERLHNDMENIFAIVSECEEKAKSKARTCGSFNVEGILRRESSMDKVTLNVEKTSSNRESERKAVEVTSEVEKTGLRRQCSIGEDVVKILDEMEEELNSASAVEERAPIETEDVTEDVCCELSNEEEDVTVGNEAPGEDKIRNQVATSAEILVIITNLVTSCMRGLHECRSKLKALDLLTQLSARISSETLLDRILPYVLDMLRDVSARARARAVRTLNQCLLNVQEVPASDTYVFPEYVLPSLAPLTRDSAVIVRASFAENIAQLAETALRYLEQSEIVWAKNHRDSVEEKAASPTYESELQTLHEMVQLTVSTLLTDQQNLVRRTLLHNGISKLCTFFGKNKANDVLLSHMITFLNDKNDKELRGSFFDCIVGVATYVGCHASPIILPLLQQEAFNSIARLHDFVFETKHGYLYRLWRKSRLNLTKLRNQGLTDPEEFVSVKAVAAITSLAEIGLLHKSALYELVTEATPYLLHPNRWIRLAVVDMVSAVARVLPLVDVHCKILVILQPYLRQPLTQPDKEEVLLNALQKPVPRAVFDSFLKCPDINLVLDTLSERLSLRKSNCPGHVIPHRITRISPQLFRRLISEGMTESVEEQILKMSKHLCKINKYRVHFDLSRIEEFDARGKVQLNEHQEAQKHSVVLSHDVIKVDISTPRGKTTSASSRSTRRGPSSDPAVSPMNAEWQHMFGGAEANSSSWRSSEQYVSGSPPRLLLSEINAVSTRSEDPSDLHPERSYIQYRCPPCRRELRSLLKHKTMKYTMRVVNNAITESGWGTLLPPPGWRLRGTLIAHLHEHSSDVTRLIPFPDSSIFASSSTDGTIRIWDCAKMEGRSIVNRSKQILNRQVGPILGMTACQGEQSLAAVSQNGSVFVVRIEKSDKSGNKMSFMERQLDINEEGYAVDITSQSGSLVVYATMYGSLVGWDLRAPGVAWKLENDLKYGLITAMCMEPKGSWLALGTSSGIHICWDLRFQLPVSTIQHPSSARVRRLICHPTEPSWLISAVQGNNEISMWNLESKSRQMMLWSSPSQPLSPSQVNKCTRFKDVLLPPSSESACALLTGVADRSPFLLSGGSERRLRYWDLGSPLCSRLVVPAAHDVVSPANLSYNCRLIDGITVVQEETTKSQISPSSDSNRTVVSRGKVIGVATEEVPRPGPEKPPAGHIDWISDLAMCSGSPCFVLSASRDGVIKVWK